MTWMALVAFVFVFLVPSVARRRHEIFLPSRPRSFSMTGVEGVRKLSKQKKAALDAATSMLR